MRPSDRLGYSLLGSGSQAQSLKRRHILDLDDFTKEEINLVFSTADAMKDILSREIKKVPTLRGKTVVTLFYEPSTRTRVSFEMAAKALSADTVSLTAQASSVVKGESLIDTGRTIQALGADLIVVRHPNSGAPYLLARHVDSLIINGGDGWHAHPTQALLDMYTIRERLGRIEGLKVAIVGDVLHSRVARSNIWGLWIMGAQVMVCGPPTLFPRQWAAEEPVQSEAPGLGSLPPVSVEWDLDKALEEADVVMALRLQRERQQGGLLPNLREYERLYQINAERLSKAKPNALVMHPGPVNEGVEITVEVARSAQSVIEEQVTNGVAIRMALLYLLLGGRR